MTPFEMAKMYYPHLWELKRLDALLSVEKITQDEYNQLVYPVVEEEPVVDTKPIPEEDFEELE